MGLGICFFLSLFGGRNEAQQNKFVVIVACLFPRWRNGLRVDIEHVEEAATAATATATPGPPTSTGCLHVPVANLTKIEFRNMLAKRKCTKKEPPKDYKKKGTQKIRGEKTKLAGK